MNITEFKIYGTQIGRLGLSRSNMIKMCKGECTHAPCRALKVRVKICRNCGSNLFNGKPIYEKAVGVFSHERC